MPANTDLPSPGRNCAESSPRASAITPVVAAYLRLPRLRACTKNEAPLSMRMPALNPHSVKGSANSVLAMSTAVLLDHSSVGPTYQPGAGAHNTSERSAIDGMPGSRLSP